MMAELFGKKTGYNKGKGGSMHIAEVDIGMLGASAIVGAGIPIAGGAALSAKLKGTDQVSVCFLGDDYQFIQRNSYIPVLEVMVTSPVTAMESNGASSSTFAV